MLISKLNAMHCQIVRCLVNIGFCRDLNAGHWTSPHRAYLGFPQDSCLGNPGNSPY